MKFTTNLSGDLIDLAEHGPQAVVLGLMKALIAPIRLPGLAVKSAYREYHLLRWKLKRLKDWGEAGEPPKITNPWGGA